MYVLFVFLCNLCLQGVHVAGNVSAIKRSVDAFGLQSMHIIGENLNMKPGNVKININLYSFMHHYCQYLYLFVISAL